jgi:hypothetical protein
LATAGRLHNGLVALLPGARHLALLDDPERFATALESVLAGVRRDDDQDQPHPVLTAKLRPSMRKAILASSAHG